MISSVSADQHEILHHICTLYVPTGFYLDVTYSTGRFYNTNSVAEPRYKSDLYPQRAGVIAADTRALPFRTGSIPSAVFDPPFIHAAGKDSRMGQRFGSYPSQRALHGLYRASLAELNRVLVPRGVLVVKCQDIVESGKQVMNHCLIWDMARALNMEALDIFILLATNRLIGHNHAVQQHARKLHSYFWVFRTQK